MQQTFRKAPIRIMAAKMLTVFFGALQLLQVLPLGHGGPIPLEDGLVHITKRQAPSSPDWTAGEFTECSVACNAGFRVRSVRCLTRDGIISFTCDTASRPASYEFCNQINCTTGNPDTTLLPSSGIYNFELSNTSRANLQFVSEIAGSYSAVLNTTESDGTITVVTQTVTPVGTQTRVSVSGANNDIDIQQSGNTASLNVDEAPILALNGVQQTNVPSTESLVYQNGVVSILGGEMLANVPNLVYYDGFRFYRFDDATLDPLEGPGVLYYNPATNQALFSNNINLNTNLDQAIRGLTTDPATPAPVTTPPSEASTQPTAVTSQASTATVPTSSVTTSTSTVTMPASTDAPDATEEPDDCDVEETEESTRGSRSRKSKRGRKQKSKSTRTRRHGKSAGKSAKSACSSRSQTVERTPDSKKERTPHISKERTPKERTASSRKASRQPRRRPSRKPRRRPRSERNVVTK